MGKVATITHMGVTLTITEWAKRLGITRVALHNRLKNGWEFEKVFAGAKLLPMDIEAQAELPAWPPKEIVVQGEVVVTSKMRTRVKDYQGLDALRAAQADDRKNNVVVR